MRKTNIYMIIAIAISLVASVTLLQVRTVSAQASPVGVVIAYTPGESITIVDQQGNQQQYMLAASLKILPPGGQRALGVGSFVTVIAPASLGDGKATAVGIVVHPNVPPGWKIPSLSATPLATDTATPTGTLLTTETVTVTATMTAPVTETMTETTTPNAIDTPTDTPTATPTPAGGASATSNTFIDWLRSLFRQLLTRS